MYLLVCFFFFFNDTATTEIYTLSLHDALPIFQVIDILLKFSVLLVRQNHDSTLSQSLPSSGIPPALNTWDTKLAQSSFSKYGYIFVFGVKAYLSAYTFAKLRL